MARRSREFVLSARLDDDDDDDDDFWFIKKMVSGEVDYQCRCNTFFF